MPTPFVKSLLPLFCAGAMCCTALAQGVPHAATAGGDRATLTEATRAFRAGSAASANGDLAGAERDFRRVVRLEPKVAAAHTALGGILRARGKTAEAEGELNTALGLDARDQTALLNLAICYAVDGQDADAVETWHRLQALDTLAPGADRAEAAIPLAAALSRTGQPAAAETLLNRAAAAHPDDARLADALGTIEAAQGNYLEARAVLEKAIALDKTLAPAYFHLGAVLLAQGKPEPALPPCEKAHSLEPGNAAYTLQLAHALDLAGREADVVALLQKALAGAPPGDVRTEMSYRIALALQSEGQSGAAIRWFDAVLAERPRDAEALINAGLARVQTGDAKGGIALYERALAAGSPTATLREDLGVAYLQQGDLAEALKQFQAGLALDPQNPQLHYDLGLAFKLKDNLAEAVPEFVEAARLDPALPDPPYTLGVIYMQQGRFADAAEMLKKTTELRPDNGDAWATLGSVERELAQPEQAEAALRRAIQLLPEQPSPHINLASVLMGEGKKTEAIAERKRGAELTRIAVNRQKADFAVKSGAALLEQNKVPEALVQYRAAVEADPSYAVAHAGLATALDRAGQKAQAAEERRAAASLPAR